MVFLSLFFRLFFFFWSLRLSSLHLTPDALPSPAAVKNVFTSNVTIVTVRYDPQGWVSQNPGCHSHALRRADSAPTLRNPQTLESVNSDIFSFPWKKERWGKKKFSIQLWTSLFSTKDDGLDETKQSHDASRGRTQDQSVRNSITTPPARNFPDNTAVIPHPFGNSKNILTI